VNGIIYCRVSSKDQIEGTSLESQELACLEYARSKNIGILEIFIEQGESAKFADRTQLLELIDFCRENKGKVEALLVWKVDRFARNVQDHFNIKATLMKYGVRIVSVTEPIDTNPEGKLMETILAGFAQFDNDIRAMRTLQGMRRKLQEGLFPWKAPKGYVSVTKGEKKSRPDQPDQPLFGILQRAWQALLTGAYTKAEIRRLLGTWGVMLSAQSADNLFSNPYYAGVLLDRWSGEECPGLHMPMVTREEFARVQQILRRRARSVPHQRARPEFPLRGLVRCAACRRYLTGSSARGRSRRYPYYHCHNRTCDAYGRNYATEDLHAGFRSFLAGIAPKREVTSKLGAVLVQMAEERRAFAQTKEARRRAELERVNRQLQELIRMKTDGLITDDEFRAHRAVLADRRLAVESKSVIPAVSGEEVRRRLNEIVEPLAEIDELWGALSYPARRRFEQLLLPVGFVNGEIRTAELGLLFTTFRDFSRENSNGVPLVGKCWNRIWAEIKAFCEILSELRERPGARDEAVRKLSHNYPSRDNFEPRRAA
jgi:DNA invertase Pin-like site-specific DNA recombinase